MALLYILCVKHETQSQVAIIMTLGFLWSTILCAHGPYLSGVVMTDSITRSSRLMNSSVDDNTSSIIFDIYRFLPFL